MVKKIIILGELNKKHLLPFFLAVFQIVKKIFNKYYPEKIGNSVFSTYATSLGMLSIIFLPYIFKLKIQEDEKEKEIHKDKWLHYLLLILINWIYNTTKVAVIIAKSLASKVNSGINQTFNPLAEGPFAYIGLEMILLTVASIIVLKYKYFIHHVISIVAFILLGNICDLILSYYYQITELSAASIIMQVLSVLTDVIYYYYQKYLMEKLFYPYWKISFTIGISLFIYSTALLIDVLVKKENAQIINGKAFYLYFQTGEAGIKIGKILMTYFLSVISTILYILNIYYFNPNYILISYQFSKFVDVLINEPQTTKLYFIIFFVFQLFFLMIYLEILEFNFCNLNKNTKKNIEFRSLLESQGSIERSVSEDLIAIDINKDYSLNINENEDNIEMITKDDNEANH